MQNLSIRRQNCQDQLLVGNNGIRKNIAVYGRKTKNDSLPIAVKTKLKMFPLARNTDDKKPNNSKCMGTLTMRNATK